MKNRLAGLLAVAALAGLSGSASAQTVSTVREVVRVVKAGKAGGAGLLDARIGTTLAPGDRIRTAGRSAAGLRFADGSLLRVGELSEVVVTSPTRKSVRVLRGEIFADYKSPGTITGGYAVAAVRGTRLLYREIPEEDQAIVRCYEGQVVVGSDENPVVGGTTTAVTGTTLTDPLLVESGVAVGSQIRFVEGPYAGQTRRITAVDAAAGRITFEPALPARGGAAASESGVRTVALQGGGAAASGYYIARDISAVRILPRNTGCTVPRNGPPSQVYPVAGQAFALGQRRPWFEEMAQQTFVTAGSRENQTMQEENFAQRAAINTVTGAVLGGEAPSVEDPCGGDPLPGGGTGNPSADCFGIRAAGIQGRLGRALASSVVQQRRAAPGGGTTPRPEEIFLPSNVRQPFQFDEGDRSSWRLEPFGFISDDTDVLGARVRFNGVSGNTYLELGYRYQLLDGQSEHDISEGFVHTKGPLGQLMLGRQHLFLGPANNTDIGTLLGLESTDAAVYELPLKRGLRQQFAYVFDSDALRSGGFAGWYARGQAPFRGGFVGYSLLDSRDDNTRIGWSLDLSQPVIRNVLDVYGEGGVDTQGRDLGTAGIYLPGIYQKTGIDVFMEYAVREAQDERVSLRLRRDIGRGLLATIFVDKVLGGDWTGGGGLLWSLKFR